MTNGMELAMGTERMEEMVMVMAVKGTVVLVSLLVVDTAILISQFFFPSDTRYIRSAQRTDSKYNARTLTTVAHLSLKESICIGTTDESVIIIT